MPSVAVARHAMATRFEIILHGDNPVTLRAAGEEALDEIERLDAQLSLYRPTSEIAHLNARASREPVRVEPALFSLLEHAQRLQRETGGAFDITIGPLIRCWGFMGGMGKVPRPADLAAARAKAGMELVRLNPESFTAEFLRDGVTLDLGAIGKGYAIERAARLLRDAGVTSAILHGGTSTVYALGQPPDADAWKVAIEYPEESKTGVSPVPNDDDAPKPWLAIGTNSSAVHSSDRRDACATLVAVVPLKDAALSVSAVWGKSFQRGDKTYGHVIDPRTGRPASKAVMAVVALSSATETDALSTALLTVGIKGHDQIAKLRPGMRTLVLEPAKGTPPFQVRSLGFNLLNPRAGRRARQVRRKSALKKSP